MGFGKEIKRLREAAGMSARETAELIGVDPERLRKWELKDFAPRYEDRVTIESFFGMPIGEIGSLSKLPTVPNAVAKRIISARETLANRKKNEAVMPGFGRTLGKDISEASDLGAATINYVNKSGTEFIELSAGRYIMNTPLITKKAYAGYLAGWGDDEYISELPTHPIIVDKPHLGYYRSFEVTGDSMDDGTSKAIQEGDIITGRKIDRAHWKNKLHLKKFTEYIIVSLDGIIVKEIVLHDTNNNTITCRSYNPDKAKYADFELSLTKVIQIFNIVLVTKKR